MRWKRKPNKLNLFMKVLRKTPRYIQWKGEVLQRDFKMFPLIPKNIQVHHLIHLSQLLREQGIESIEEALECLELWKPTLGVCLSRGEHTIVHKLERIKYANPAFLTLLAETLQRLSEQGLRTTKQKMTTFKGAGHAKRRAKEEEAEGPQLSSYIKKEKRPSRSKEASRKRRLAKRK